MRESTPNTGIDEHLSNATHTFRALIPNKKRRANCAKRLITEVGRRRVSVSMLPAIAKLLGVSIETLIGHESKATAAKRGPAPKLQQQVDRITRLPKAQQRFVMQVIDSVLAQAGR